MASAQEIQTYRAQFAALTDSELINKMHETVSHSPPHIAARQIFEERKEKKEEERHGQALSAASTANHVAKWAIVLAVIALIVSIVQAFWH